MDPAYESAQRHLKDKVASQAAAHEAQVMAWAFELYRDARRTWIEAARRLNERDALDLWEMRREDIIQECEDDARAFAKVWSKQS